MLWWRTREYIGFLWLMWQQWWQFMYLQNRACKFLQHMLEDIKDWNWTEHTHMGSIHGMIISSSCSWNDKAPSSSSLYAAHGEIEIDCDIYCDVCDSISPVRDGLGSHKRAMHLKKHNLEDYAGRSNFWYRVLKKESATLVQEEWWVNLLSSIPVINVSLGFLFQEFSWTTKNLHTKNPSMEQLGRHCKRTHLNRSPCQECDQCPGETQRRKPFRI